MKSTGSRKPATTRQRYLSLVSRLYDLASEFADEELKEMIREWAANDRHGVRDAIEALVRLHADFPPVAAKSESYSISHPRREGRAGPSLVLSADGPVSTARSSASIEEILSDKLLFPKLMDIAALLPDEIDPPFKEARDRYVRRVVRSLENVSAVDKAQFLKRVRQRIETNGDDGSFISSWKNLIRDL
ncbi:hypothetical protein [Stenotrophomonas maltophilia]|uniref:hypothetical protein n=1 Tax=Stenotrophomonas maltophilia TaxID=40324 RepID=UPI0034D6539C